MVKIAVFVSGGGTNLQALIDAENNGALGRGKLSLCVSSKEGAFALTRAENHGMKTAVISKKSFSSQEEYSKAMLDLLAAEKIDIIVLAGFLTILPTQIISSFQDKIVNVHPSLIPSFCGEGFYGLKVHQSALEYGVKVTGATVHLVSEIVDGGRILLQKAVDIDPNDTAETLQKRVMEQCEWVILPQAVKELCDTL